MNPNPADGLSHGHAVHHKAIQDWRKLSQDLLKYLDEMEILISEVLPIENLPSGWAERMKKKLEERPSSEETSNVM